LNQIEACAFCVRHLQKENNMSKLAIGVATAAILAFAAPASAQVHVREGGGGVNVRIGPNHRHHHDRADCRVRVTRIHRDDGTVITRRVRRCG